MCIVLKSLSCCSRVSVLMAAWSGLKVYALFDDLSDLKIVLRVCVSFLSMSFCMSV